MKQWRIGAVLFVRISSAQTLAPRPPLVNCETVKNLPCIVLASKTSDMAGVWKQYQSNPAFAASGGMVYIRYSADGTFVLADAPENTAAVYKTFPHGTFSFEGNRMTLSVQGVPWSRRSMRRNAGFLRPRSHRPSCTLVVKEVA